ncbi:hypothetical protein, partial [Okeania sp. SIO2G5]|uniref:hypothetical protein n=1 Tax=Okeania sp. SIO2G5 TaxID=2607796 RepID=UPI0025809669
LPGISSSHRKIASKSRIEKLIVKFHYCDIRNSRTSNLESKETEKGEIIPNRNLILFQKFLQFYFNQ